MNRGVRAVVVVVIALIAASIATYAVYQGIQRMPVREVEVASQPVVVAAKALPVGALVAANDVKLAEWPSKSLVAGGFARVEDVVGQRPAERRVGERADHRDEARAEGIGRRPAADDSRSACARFR